MASILNVANCGNTANTGHTSCDIQLDMILYAIAIPKGFVIPATSLTDVTTFNAYLASKFISDSRSSRFFLSPELTDLDDKTGDAITTKRNNYEATVQAAPYNWGWKLNGSHCDYKNWLALVRLQQARFDFLLVDASGSIWGASAADTTGAAGLGGYAMYEIWVDNFKPKTASDIETQMFRLKFLDNRQVVENGTYVAANYIPSTSGAGLIGVTLTRGATTNTTTQYYVKGNMGCGGTSLGTTYGTTIAVAGAWVLRNTSTATVITPSAVTYLPDTDEYKFTVTAATTGNIISVALAAPSVLTVTPYFAPVISETPLTFASL